MRVPAAVVIVVLGCRSLVTAQTPSTSTPRARPAPVASASAPSDATADKPGAPVIIQTPDDASRTEWEKRVAHMIRHGELRLREEQASPDNVRRDQWFVQLYKGVPVIGAEVWRQMDAKKAVAVEGSFYTGISLNPVPKLTRQEAQDALAALAGGGPGPSLPPTLGVLPRADGTFVLVYQGRVYTDAGLTLYSLDASTGAVVQSDEDSGPPKN